MKIRLRALHVLAALILLCPLFAAHAESPPAEPPTFYAFIDTAPADGEADVFRDMGVRLNLAGVVSDDPPVAVPPDPLQLIDVQVTNVATGSELPGELSYVLVGLGIVWRPASPLPENATLRVVASLDQSTTRPAGAEGDTEITFTFQTGEAFAPPIRFEGNLRFDLRRGPLADSVEVTLPEVQGGIPLPGYYFKVWFTPDEPLSASPSQAAVDGSSVIANGPSSSFSRTGTWRLPEMDRDHRPCISLEVSDVVGSAVSSACHDEVIGPSGCGCAAGSSAAPPLPFVVGALLAIRRRRTKPEA